MIFVCAAHLVDAHFYIKHVLGREWLGQEDGSYSYEGGAGIVGWPDQILRTGEPGDELHIVGKTESTMIQNLIGAAEIVGIEVIYAEIRPENGEPLASEP